MGIDWKIEINTLHTNLKNQTLNTKILMIASSIFLIISGLAFTFITEEITQFLDVDTNQTSILFFQILGSLYFGFGLLNWMAKNNLIGGIYSKPLIVGNLAHFLISTFALVRIVGNYSNQEFIVILSLTILYSIFTLGFGYVFNKTPIK